MSFCRLRRRICEGLNRSSIKYNELFVNATIPLLLSSRKPGKSRSTVVWIRFFTSVDMTTSFRLWRTSVRKLRYTPDWAGQQFALQLSSIVAIPIRSRRSVLACKFARCFLASCALTPATSHPLERKVFTKFSAYAFTSSPPKKMWLRLIPRWRHERATCPARYFMPSGEFLTENGLRRMSP